MTSKDGIRLNTNLEERVIEKTKILIQLKTKKSIKTESVSNSFRAFHTNSIIAKITFIP